MPNGFSHDHDRLKQALDELTSLNQIANAINALMAVDKITQVIIDHCLKKIRASQGAVFLLDEKKVEQVDVFKTFIREFSISSDKIPMHLNESITGWMIKYRTMLVSNNPDSDDRFKGFKFAPMGVHSILAAPLLTKSGLIGALVLFNKKDGEGFGEDDKRFLGIVGAQAAKVIENARLHEQEEKYIAIQEEIKLAQSIQQGFLPRCGLKTANLDICGFNHPAKEVGGDFYDIVKLDENRVFISLGDVSGKGIPAALLMANAQAVFRSQLFKKGEIRIEDLATSLNNLICQFSGPGQFITALFGIYDIPSQKFTYINAGHLPPIILNANGDISQFEAADLVIGVLPDINFGLNEILLKEGDILFIYSDGIIELYGKNDEQFGEIRLAELLGRSRNKDASTICSSIFQSLNEFRSDCVQSDDITMIALKILER
jgi:sigma-B regulation protein RsbU (phosphoserine phosphatase)